MRWSPLALLGETAPLAGSILYPIPLSMKPWSCSSKTELPRNDPRARS